MSDTVVDEIEKWSKHFPDDCAIKDSTGRAISYGELWAEAEAIGSQLTSSGIQAGDIVGVALPRTTMLGVSLLGVFLAGGSYLPIDPRIPVARAQKMLEDSNAKALITCVGVESNKRATIKIEKREACPGSNSLRLLPDRMSEDRAGMAYVIYTSGSTGEPKGVGVSHDSLLSMIKGVIEKVGVPSQSVWTCAHSASFDFSVWEIWGSLYSGGRLVLLDDEQVRDPQNIATVIDAENIGVFSQTPSAFRYLMRELIRSGVPESLLVVVLGGEAVAIDEFRDWFDGGYGARIYNLYGVTEATVHSTVKRLTPQDLQASVKSPIGAPIRDVTIAVLDEAGQPVTKGHVGELYVGGVGVALGYIGSAALSEKRFVHLDVFGRSGRWYRSGDAARELPNGEFEYVGRLDRQIKLRGYRVELGEIEASLMAHPQVAAAAVERIDDARVDYLIAFIVPRSVDARVDADELKRHLARTLPEYMVPRAFRILAQLPLTPNGKIDHDRLLRPGIRQR